jgi:uncharacterized protein YkwD
MRASIPLVTAALIGGQVVMTSPAPADPGGPRVTAVVHHAAITSYRGRHRVTGVVHDAAVRSHQGRHRVTAVVRKAAITSQVSAGRGGLAFSRLRIAIDGAPKGRVTVSGPRTNRTVSDDVTLRVPVGTYRVKAAGVTTSGNDYAPTRRSWRVGVRRGALTLVSATYERRATSAEGGFEAQGPPAGDMATLFDLVNRARATGQKCGGRTMPAVDPLAWDEDLAQAARLHAEDMSARDYFDHDSLDGRSFAARIRATAYDGYPAGENIAMGFQSAEAVMDGWLDSPGHCVNLMDPDFDDLGLGFASRTDAGYSLPTTFWVQDFGYRG